jgi:molecular chaperone HtpG
METVQQIPQSQYETYNYSANTSNMMNLLVNSIYTNKEIFLRELISNAADAIKKACVFDYKYGFANEIKISYNKDLSQLIIQDSGCGITKEDLIEKIGSIGTSGTKQFMETIKQSKNTLIGQFGVGFYSVYLVAESIQIITKPVQEPNKIYEWISNSESSYSIREINDYDYDYDNDNEFNRGTKIILTLKSDCSEYLEQDKLIEIIKTYSSYIEYPILFEKQEYKKDQDGKYLDEKEKIWEKINWIPLWAKDKSTISEEDYNNFYLENIKDNIEQVITDPPLSYRHFKVEGEVNLIALLYIPLKAPFNLFEQSKRSQSLKLYTKNVLITADHKDLYPKWMEFIKGIVDTSDIELNISRETVQNTHKLRKIHNYLIKKAIEMFEDLVEDKTKYLQFYKEFSCSLKNGIHEEFSRNTNDYDESHKMAGNNFGKKMLKLLRFHTSFGRFIGFDEYVSNMKPTQKAIYYIAGDKKEVLESSPFMYKLKKFNLEVLYFEEPIDEYIKGYLTEYIIDEKGNSGLVGIHDRGFERFKKPNMTDLNTKTFVDIARDELLIELIPNEIDSIEENELNSTQGKELCDKLKELYSDQGIVFFKVILDDKFIDVPAIIVNQLRLSSQLEKQLNNSTGTKRNEQYKPAFDRKNMLISNSNEVIQYMYKKLCIDCVPLNDPDIVDKAKTIYTMALMAGGYEPDNSSRLISTINKLLPFTFL